MSPQSPENEGFDGQNWLVANDGSCQELTRVPSPSQAKSPYRLYRFLSDLDDVLDRAIDDAQRLQLICPLVRRLLSESPWLQLSYDLPDPKKGWSVSMLYDEPDYPLTVQMVAWEPGRVSPIHNHATWGIVALLDGEEKNTFWQRSRDREYPDRIEPCGDRVLYPGDIIALLPEAIHCVEATRDRPTISFNLYGKTQYDRRFTFNPATHTATLF